MRENVAVSASVHSQILGRLHEVVDSLQPDVHHHPGVVVFTIQLFQEQFEFFVDG